MNKIIALSRIALVLATFSATYSRALADDKPPSIDAIVALNGNEFYRGIGKLSLNYTQPTPPLADLWRLMEKLEVTRKMRQARGEKGYNSAQGSAYRGVVDAIGATGASADTNRLLKIYDSLSVESYLHSTFLDALSDWWIRRQLASLAKSPRPIALPLRPKERTFVLPAQLQNAAPSLQKAWRLYKNVQTPFHEAFIETDRGERGRDGEKPLPTRIEVQNSWPAFYRVIGDFLHGADANRTIQKLASFQWGHWCGTGSDQLYEPKYRTMWMALWQAGRFDLAAGAALAASNADNLRFGGDESVDLPRQFLVACGFSWQQIDAGAMVDGRGRGEELAALGSEEGALLLAQMANLPHITSRDDYLNAVAAFIAPAPFASGYVPQMIGRTRLPKGRAIAAPLQERLLAILHAKMRDGAGYQTAQLVSGLLRELRRPESVATLKIALDSPFVRVRNDAFEALKEMGQSPAPPKTLAPLALRISANGRPLDGVLFNWAMRDAHSQRVSSGAQTNGEGVLTLNRDYLSDTEMKITAISISSQLMQTPKDLWLDIQTLTPIDLDARTDLNVKMGALSLQVQGFNAVDQKTMTVVLQAQRQKYGGAYFEAISAPMSAPVDRPLIFPALQAGRYRIQVNAPGAAQWQSPELEVAVGDTPLEVKATLEKGADLKFNLLAPGGENRNRSIDYQLLREGKAVGIYRFYDSQSGILRGLPVGNYTLKIQSSDHNTRGQTRTVTTFPAYDGREIPFIINAASPALIDLGTIKLRHTQRQNPLAAEIPQ